VPVEATEPVHIQTICNVVVTFFDRGIEFQIRVMMNTRTYILKRSEIEKAFSMGDYVSTVEEAFRLYGDGKVQMPPKLYLPFDKGDLRCMPAYISSIKAAVVLPPIFEPFIDMH
jgi:hypothetical protein